MIVKWLADQGMSTTDYVDKLRTICPICGKPDWCSFLHQVHFHLSEQVFHFPAASK